MHEYPQFRYRSKDDLLEKSERYWNPHKTRFWRASDTALVIDRRQDYFIYDMSGRRLIDVHLNGGTYNFGHRNQELIDVLKEGLERFDLGNHHFPSLARTALAEALAATAPWPSCRTIYASGGGEAIDIAIKSARHATGRRKIISIEKGYHGHTGLAMCAGDSRFSQLFHSDRPDEFIQVKFNDPAAMEEALGTGGVAAVLVETIPATCGFPMPEPGYLPRVKVLCEHYGALYIADEVQTGLMRTGSMWAIAGYDVIPDVIVSAKGIGGGLYPLGVVLVSDRAGAWLEQDGFGHMSTGGGGELGCLIGLKVVEMCQRAEVQEHVRRLTAFFADGLRVLQQRHNGFFREIRQNGLVIGLGFDHPEGARFVSRALYEQGIWAIFSTLDPRILQFKPGLLMSIALSESVLEGLDKALLRIRDSTGARPLTSAGK